MTKISTLEARKNLADVINAAQYGKDRIILTRHGKPVAGIISVDDLNLLENLEDRLDLKGATEILEDESSEYLDWEDAKKII